MFYNLKVTEYRNGEITIKHYDTPMKSPEWNPYEKEDVTIYNPFLNRVTDEKIRKNFPWEKKEITPEDRERYKMQNLYRTIQNISAYARCYPWEWFCTMTFSEEYVDRYDFKACSKLLRVWLNNQKRSYAPDLKYLFVPEQHEKGGWHFHGVMADTGKMLFVDSGHYSAGRNGRVKVYNMDKYKYGFTTATEIDDIHKVSKYIVKYITKELVELTPNQQRYFVSQSLPKPKNTLFIVPDCELDEFIQELSDSTGCNVVYTSKSNNDWCNVTYYEMQ